MKALSSSNTLESLVKAFEGAASAPTKRKPKSQQTSPFSMRLSTEERKFLEEHAGSQSWASYIKERVFGEQDSKRKSRRRPRIEDKELASALSGLGHSHLASNLNQLARHANMGTLDVSEDIERQLGEAYGAVIEMRKALFMALGFRLEDKD